VQRDEVGLGDQVVEREQLDAEAAGAIGGDVGVVGDEAHAEREGALGDQRADAAEADDAEGLAVQLDALPPGALPLAVDEGVVGLGHVAGLGQQERHRVLGGGEDVGLRRVDDHHPALGGGGDVDVVEADAGAAHDDEIGRGRQHLAGDVGGRADDHRVLVGDGGDQRGRVEAEADVDVVAQLGERGDAGRGQLLGDQDARHCRPLVPVVPRVPSPAPG
jgi:hypothetical protein